MADAFRGLTLRIGADARPVKQALDSIKSSAGQAQKQLNRLSRALKFDGTDVSALRSSLALASDKATLTARSVKTISTAMEQAARSSVEFSAKSGLASGKLKEVANATKDVYAQTQKIRAERNHVNAELQEIYDGVKNVVKASLSGKDAAEQADKYVKALQRSMVGTGDAAKKSYEYMKLLVQQAGRDTAAGAGFGLNKTVADSKKLTELWETLHAESGRLKADLKAIEKVEGYRAMRNELVALKSDLRQAVTETVRLKAETASFANAENLDKTASRIKRLGEATEAAVADAHRMDAAYAALPRSVETARNKIIATRNAQQALVTQINELRSAMSKIESSNSFDRMAAKSRNVHLAFEEASHEAVEMGVKVKMAEQNVESLESTINVLKTEMKGVEATGIKEAFIGPVANVERLEEELTQAKRKLTELRAEALVADEALDQAAMHNDWSRFNSELSEAITKLAELKTRASAFNTIKNIGAGFREVGYGLYSTVTPALMMAGRYAIQAAEDIDSAYRDMRKTVNGTEEQFEHLKQAAMDYSTTHVTSADQILEIEAMGGQLGLASDSLEAFATTISNLDIATNIDADTAAEQLGKMASVLGMASDEYDNFGDALVRLGNNMPVMESDIMALMTRYMGMGKVVGMSADEMLAWSAAASATGQKAEAAGSSMQRFISNIETAVTGGGDELEMFAKIAGMTSQEFVDKFGHDASGAMRDFVAGLGEMQKNGESVNQALKDLGINNVRDKQLLEGLAVQMANATDGMSELDYALRLSSEAYRGFESTTKDGGIERAGDAAREAAKKAEGFSGSLQMMKNQAQVLGATLADSAAPFLRDLGVLLADLTDKFRNMPDGMKTLTLQMLALTAAVGPVSVAFGTLLRSGASIFEFASGMQKSLTLTGQKISMFGGSLANAAGKVTKTSQVFGVLGRAISALGSTKAMLAGAGIAVYLAIVSHEYDNLIERNDQYAMATSRLKSSLDDIRSSYTLAASDTGRLSGVQETASKSTEDLIAQQADLSKAIIERNDNAKGTIASLNGAKDVISELMNRTEKYGESAALTATEQGRLKSAIELVNSVCGTHYAVVDAMNGKIADERGELVNTIGAIGDYIEAKKRQIQADAMMKDLQDLYPQQLEWYTKLVAAQREVQKATEGGDPFGISAAVSNYNEVVGHYREITDQIETLEADLGSLSEQETKAAQSISDLAERSQLIKSAFAGNKDAFEGFKYELNNCGLTMESFKQVNDETWAKAIATWLNGGGKLRDILQDMGVGVMGVAQQYQTELGNAGKSFEEFASAAGVSVDTLAESLNFAGLSAMQLSEMGIDGFNQLLAAVDGDVTNIGALIDALNAKSIEPKDIHVNGDEITTATGDVYTLEAAADAAGSKTYTLTLTANTSQAQQDVNTLEETEVDDKSFETDDGGTTEEATDEVNELDQTDISDKDFTVSVTDHASGTLDSIISKLGDIQDKEVTVTTNHVENGKTATGGIYVANARGAILRNAMGGVLSRIPRHADGALNGIVTRATMTNIGWVGEAGAEAVMHMKNAGGAVVPLTNRRYVRPFARAVASEMGGGRSVNVTVQLNYQAGDDATRLARDVANRIETYMAMGA